MELFHELYNTDLRFLMELASLRQFSLEDACKLAAQKWVNAEYGDVRAFVRKWIDMGVISEEKNGMLSISRSNGYSRFPAPLSMLEQEYLLDICKSKEASLFLSPELKSKITQLGFYDPGRMRFIKRRDSYGKRNRIAASQDTFHSIIYAIYQQKKIHYQYTTRHSNVPQTAEAVPYRLEYNVFDGRWWVILYLCGENDSESRPVKSRLENIHSVELCERHYIREAEIRNSIMSKLIKEPVVLRIEDKKNALERTFLAFESMLEMKAIPLDNRTVELQFRYFSWDRRPIIRKLLFLGEHVSVISPQYILDEYLQEVRNAWMLQKTEISHI